MKPHVYLHTSKLNVIQHLREDSLFEPAFQYPRETYDKCHANEYGKIKTKDVDYHLILGQIRGKDCPYCGSKSKMEYKEYFDSFGLRFVYWGNCQSCGARGPCSSTYLKPNDVNPDITSHLEEKCIYEFANPRPWDYNLKLEDENEAAIR
jgi:hypothetical protein